MTGHSILIWSKILSPYLKHTLDNGVQLIAEKFDTVQSVSIGMFLKSGVLYESEKLQGVSHFIEHMMFKGTRKRTARMIASEFDRIGGYLNAFTAKDYCCYYARVVKDRLDVAIDVLADMIINSQFVLEELERERRVILEEIKMYEDSPDEIIHELLSQNIWKNARLGSPILGTAQTVAAMQRDDIFSFFNRQYVTGNLLVSAAGNFDWDELKQMLEKKLKKMRSGTFKPRETLPRPTCDVTIHQKEIEQVHLTLGTPGVSFSDDRRFALTILNAAFGGGMSSRLFQEIREKRGLAYTVYSYHTSFKKTGLLGIYAGTSMEHLEKVLELFHAEIDKIAARGLSARELEDTREQLKGNMLIALESTTNRMNRLSTGFLYGVEPKRPEDTLKPYLETTTEDIKKVAGEILDRDRMAITMIAPGPQAAGILANSPFGGRPIVAVPSSRGQNKA
ncbi:MAG: peptidase M16 [Candidatus Riflebacteria bacterium HGW-Riflebacteria-2]|jgi:predicted Zn-dependent peptidase|nr:MAG: peptidase M16 [Candidatus Riflebacteria bacterium HGW-Riflebacteria-2]